MEKPVLNRKKITDYQPDPANPNKHSERGVSMLGDSLAAVGLGRSIDQLKSAVAAQGRGEHVRFT